MKKILFTAPIALLLTTGTMLAQGNNPLIVATERGSFTLLFPTQPVITLGCAAAADPGPGGLSNALTCNLGGPPALIAGDLRLQETAGDGFSDVIRFNPAGTGTAGYAASFLFYSDTDDSPLLPADTGLPTASYTNVVTALETSLGGGMNGYLYTPTANQPGFVPGFSVTYEFISDAATVPEPASAALFATATGLLLGYRAWRKQRASSAA